MDIEQVRRRHESRLMRLPNVVGVGIGRKAGQPAIAVFVTRKVPEAELSEAERVPRRIEGIQTVVVEVGVVGEQGAGDGIA